MGPAVRCEKAMCWIVTVCVHLLITCCYQRLATRPRVCIFPADWPQSASPLPALWLAVQTGAPAQKHTQKRKGTEGQEYVLIRVSFIYFY